LDKEAFAEGQVKVGKTRLMKMGSDKRLSQRVRWGDRKSSGKTTPLSIAWGQKRREMGKGFDALRGKTWIGRWNGKREGRGYVCNISQRVSG